MAGIEQTKEMLIFGFKLGEAFESSLKDGKFTLTDLQNFLPAVMSAPAAFSQIEELPKELADLDANEMAALKTFVQQEFNLEDDELELKIEAALGLALNIYLFIKSI